MNKQLSSSLLIILILILTYSLTLADTPFDQYINSKFEKSQESAGNVLAVDSSSLFEIEAEWVGIPQWMGGVDNNYETFGGSISKGIDFFGSNLNAGDYVPVEIHFDSDSANWSNAQFFKRPGYASMGVGKFPGTVWDISAPSTPRRLNICIVELDDGFGGLPDPNFFWDPDTSAQGRFEYLFIMKSDYDSTGMAYADSNVLLDDMDNLYAWWPRVADGHTFFETDTAKLIIRTLIGLHPTAMETSVELTWINPGQDPDNFKIFWGEDSTAGTFLIELSGDSRSYTDSQLITENEYFYQIKSYDTSGNEITSSRVQRAKPRLITMSVSLFGQWNGRTDYGDIWGYVDSATGKEYALICARGNGLSIVSIDSLPLEEVGFVPGGNDTKDVKTYSHYAVIFQEGGNTLIADIQDVTSPQIISNIPGGRHNGLVDGYYVYLVGGSPSGLVIYSIQDPANPVYVGEYSPYYYHDVVVRNDTLAACGIYGDGVDILDLADRSDPQLIGHFNYTGSGAHNAAFSEDGNYIFVGDEIGTGNHTRVFDISDLNDISKVSDIIVDPNTITHNCYVKGEHLFIAHYVDGLRVWNISDPTEPYEVTFYDTHPELIYGFAGAWGVYPYFESGKVILSDMQNGLYVFESTLLHGECCIGNRGDIDGDNEVMPTATDLSYLIDYIYRGGPSPSCESEADVDGDSNSATVVDLSYIVDNLFRGGPAPPSCP